MTNSYISDDSDERKQFPIARGCLDYFPRALAEVARVSFYGNMKHNPGQEMHHARGKSGDHADCVIRHIADRGTFDEVTLFDPVNQETITVKIRHSAYAAWRALALLQQECEDDGLVPPARAARFPVLHTPLSEDQ